MHYKNLLLLIILCRLFSAQSQNLVKNPGFEDHTPVICVGCHAQKEFFAHVRNWHNTGWIAQLFSKKYEFKKSETEKGYFKKDYLPRSGDGVVEFLVRGTTARTPVKGGGGSSYLHTKLSKTLTPGTLYRVQMWVKIKNPTANTSDRFAFLKHFGMELSDRALKADAATQLLRAYTPFLLDTVVSGEWIAVNYLIRPTRPLDYLTIGWFEDPLQPVYWRNDDTNHWAYLLVDDISITPVLYPDTQDTVNAIDYPFEKPLKGIPPETDDRNDKGQACAAPDSINIYFDNKIDTLNAPAMALLDAFAHCLQNDTIEYAIEIRGFTDAVGSDADNLALSARRAEAVKHYLKTRHHLSELQLITSSHGEEAPKSHAMAENSGQRRRVAIKKSSTRVSDLMYRK